MKSIPSNIPISPERSEVSGQSPLGQSGKYDFESQLSNTHEDPTEQENPLETVSPLIAQIEESPKLDRETTALAESRLDNLLTAVMDQCQVLSDEKGQKLVLMTLLIPGRGQVKVRLWKRTNGIDIRLRPTDPGVTTRLKDRKADLEANLRHRGIQTGQVVIT